MDTARAFQTAREREWIVDDGRYRSDRSDPRYRLTPLGTGELAREPDRHLRSIEGGRAGVDMSVPAVIEVVGEFEESGGTSLELAAWELGVDERELETVWSLAIDYGLLEPCGINRVDGRDEQMWRLTDGGRQLRVAPDERTG
jgi:hypothetical protein